MNDQEKITELLNNQISKEEILLADAWNNGNLAACKKQIREIRRILDATETTIKNQLYQNLR